MRADDALTDLVLDPALPLLDPPRADLAVRPWLALCPPDVVVVDGFDRRTLTALCPGTPVAVRVDAPGPGRGCTPWPGRPVCASSAS